MPTNAKYSIDRFNGEKPRTARSFKQAISIARVWLGAERVYKGAEYFTDRPIRDGEREACKALDIWVDRANIKRETSQPADVVISW